MSDELRDRLAELVVKAIHSASVDACPPDFSIHVANVLVSELGLKQEWSNTANGTNRMRLSEPRQVEGCDLETRWVTGWEKS
jgi:hypothetical protein